MEIVGSALVPEMAGKYTTGYVCVRWPLAGLRVEPGLITLRGRPAWVTTAFNGASLAVSSPAEIELIFPSVGMLRTPMVGLRAATGRTYYFRPGRAAYFRASRRTAEILDLCEREGFTVSRDVRRVDLTR
ncbi:hypothetical protein [Embleya scabrispora]|uniref:hypothetical protein n=1 Tax=Embleya scabrispora TaxID=159449 RepID=UPI00036B74EB|nr:hypothetical protein [Embleya scabrispora]MYS80987.1 hypothetical protein [Streptomyces sp. SID5474]